MSRRRWPKHVSNTHQSVATSMTPVAAQVMARNFPPRWASSPIWLPYLLITLLPFTITAVTMALARPTARKPSEESITFKHAARRPDARSAGAAAISPRKMKPMAIQYSTNVVVCRMCKASIPRWISSGQLRSSSVTSTPDSFNFCSIMVVGSKWKLAVRFEQAVMFLWMSLLERVALGSGPGT